MKIESGRTYTLAEIKDEFLGVEGTPLRETYEQALQKEIAARNVRKRKNKKTPDFPT